MAMTEEEYDEVVMNLIVAGGNARSLSMEAIQAAKQGDFDKANALLEECEEALGQAHNAQTDMIRAEIRGEHQKVMLLMVNTQDHVMDAMVVKDLAREFVELYEKMQG